MDARLSEEAVENLVTQFSSALDFYRELVQNSMDAGSSTVSVWTEFQPGEGIDGTIAIHVDDFGEGMNEEIIDDQLTQLFSSTKEDDLTKNREVRDRIRVRVRLAAQGRARAHRARRRVLGGLLL